MNRLNICLAIVLGFFVTMLHWSFPSPVTAQQPSAEAPSESEEGGELPDRDLPDGDLPDQDLPDTDLPGGDLPDQDLPSGEDL